MSTTIEKLNKIISEIRSIENIKSIGLSGGLTDIPVAGKGDFDIFLYCDEIPDIKKREMVLERVVKKDDINNSILTDLEIQKFISDKWGDCDYFKINGIDTWLMYFKVDSVIEDLNKVLNGEYLDRVDNYFFPIGRVAMFQNLSILYDKEEFLKEIKLKIQEYPLILKTRMIKYNLELVEDFEDLERAVDRKDTLFYHFALDISLDHFFLCLFALNNCYFPSRKRTLKFINKFKIKPIECEERLILIIKLGSDKNTLEKSFKLYKNLIFELKNIIKNFLNNTI